MRIWDIDPGYLNRQSLLGEHRELHGVVSIAAKKKEGYSAHPETRRWIGHGWALRQRHRLLASEMALRGYKDNSPVRTRANTGVWPSVFVDEPGRQYAILRTKYQNAEQGRIALPKDAQQLWAQHKYSVLARDVGAYREIGRRVSEDNSGGQFQALARELVEILRIAPTRGGIRNALQNMWGYVSEQYDGDASRVDYWSPQRLLRELRILAMKENNEYIKSSTALGELGAWLP